MQVTHPRLFCASVPPVLEHTCSMLISTSSMATEQRSTGGDGGGGGGGGHGAALVSPEKKKLRPELPPFTARVTGKHAVFWKRKPTER